MASTMTGTGGEAGAGCMAQPVPARRDRPGGVRVLSGKDGFIGVAARFAANDTDLELVLAAANPAHSVVIGTFSEEDVVAAWRGFAQHWGLPLALERADGTYDIPYPQMGRVKLGAIRIRRRHGLLSGRRPRFLVRRKATRLPERPVVYRRCD